MEDALIPDQTSSYNLGKKGRSKVSYVTTKQFEREVQRLDRRAEIIVGAAEDRLIGKMAEMESRIMRRMDQRFDDMAALMKRGYEDLDGKIQNLDGRVQGLESKMEALDDRVRGLENKIQVLEGRMDALEARMEGLETKFQKLDAKIDTAEANLLAKMDNLKQELLAAFASRPQAAN